MIQTVEAVVDESGRVRLLGEVHIAGPRGARDGAGRTGGNAAKPRCSPRRRSRRTGADPRRMRHGYTCSRGGSARSVSADAMNHVRFHFSIGGMLAFAALLGLACAAWLPRR